MNKQSILNTINHNKTKKKYNNYNRITNKSQIDIIKSDVYNNFMLYQKKQNEKCIKVKNLKNLKNKILPATNKITKNKANNIIKTEVSIKNIKIYKQKIKRIKSANNKKILKNNIELIELKSPKNIINKINKEMNELINDKNNNNNNIYHLIKPLKQNIFYNQIKTRNNHTCKNSYNKKINLKNIVLNPSINSTKLLTPKPEKKIDNKSSIYNINKINNINSTNIKSRTTCHSPSSSSSTYKNYYK